MTPCCVPNSEELRGNIEIVMMAISRDQRACQFASEVLRMGLQKHAGFSLVAMNVSLMSGRSGCFYGRLGAPIGAVLSACAKKFGLDHHRVRETGVLHLVSHKSAMVR